MQQQTQQAWEKILPSIIIDQNPSYKTTAIIDFLKSSESPIFPPDVINMINQANIEFDWNKVEIIQNFFNSPKSPEMTPLNVIQIINETGIKIDGSKRKIIQDFIKSPSSTNFDDLVNIIKKVHIGNDLAKTDIILEFLKSQKFPETTSSQFIKMIKDFDIKDDGAKGNIIKEFLKSPKFPETNSSQIIEMIKDLDIKDDYAKGNIINEFLKSQKFPEINSSQIIEMIKDLDIKDDGAKGNIILEFLKSPKSPEMTPLNVIEIINETGIENDGSKRKIIQDLIKSPRSSTNFDDLVNIIREVNIGNDLAKTDIILEFIKSQKFPQTTSSQFIKMIKDFDIKDDGAKGNIILEFLKSPKSPKIIPQDLANMIKEVGLQNRADLSTVLYVTKFSASENYIKNFIDFTKALQPSEAMQCEFVKDFIDKNRINRDIVKGLKPFIEGLQDNDLALDLIENLSIKGMLVDEKNTLSLVKNRSKKQYAFLTEIVGDKILEDCITSEGIANLKATFGKDLKVDNQLITVSDLISYCDLKNQTSALSALLKPEFKKQLRDNFSPSAEMLLYKPTELDKLNSLLGQRGIEFDVKSYFVENAKLCDYLKEKVGDISEIDRAKTYQINFTNFGIEEKKAEINTLFNELLKSNDPNKERVVKFFSDLFGIAFSDSDGDKLKAFFQQNKKELAHCFCDENLPKENFESLFTTLRDGCFANIGTQFTSMLYGAMIKDEEAQILYGVMSSKIIAPIGANQDINHNGNPLDNTIINSYLLSPMASVTKTSQEEMLTNQKTWEIIGKIAGDDKKNEILEKLSDSYLDIKIFDQKAKEIASFLMVKNVVGEQRMTDLESKDPQLKKLGDFVYGRVQETSIASQNENSPPPSPRPQQAGSPPPLPRSKGDSPLAEVGNLESEERVVNDSHIANITSFLSTGHANLDSFFKNISKEVEGNLHLKQFVAFIKGEVPNPLKEEEEASLQRAEQAPLQRTQQVDSPSLEPRSQAESPADAVMRVIADQLSRIQFFRPPF